MKKKRIIYSLILLFIGTNIVHAAPSYSFYTSSSSITNGNSVSATIKLSNAASWNVKITSAGNTYGCSNSWADTTTDGNNTTKYLTVSCKANSIGTISFIISGDSTSSDGSTTKLSSTKSVTVTAPREKDTNNNLGSLSVKEYKISPEFKSDTTEYSVEVPSTIDKVIIEGSPTSNYASITGTGEVEVNEGTNSFEIKVTSESGSEKVYTLKVNVKDDNPINIKIDDKDYTVLKNIKKVDTPSTYEKTTVKINDVEVPAFKSDESNFILVAVKDDKGNVFYAIYNETDHTYKLYNENKGSQLLLYIESIPNTKKDFLIDSITINNQNYECLKYQDNVLIYAMNIMNGKEDYYYYDSENNTFTKYQDSLLTSYQDTIKKYQLVIIGLGGLLILVIFIDLIKAIKKPTKKKLVIPEEDIKIEKIEPKKEESKEVSSKEEKKSKKKTKEDALKNIEDATLIIENFEEKKDSSEEEPTMYDIFSEDKKSKKKK